ncbi:flap endonuclease Xni [Ferrimonas marina]|uniref:Protein Xni n=1 Tax=Ferrimonas marina TaxID=299255 RepID=A0A1M5SB46_9GAMM|nr:flap endonuclease Xni [Ferrimonas marina]SHH35709.1 protein Xni [Ferrimonas marina]
MTLRLLLVDALNLVRRIHAAVPEGDGDALCLRCQQALRKALNLHQPSHAILVWDGGHEQSWRRRLYPDYKAQRKPMPEDLAQLLPRLRAEMEATGIRSVQQADVEADDLIGTIAHKVAQHGGQVMILSTDKGFGQLHCDAIGQWDHFAGSAIDADSLQSRVGVAPAQLLDFWALAGDSGNGIPGVPGIGKKTAQKLLSEYGSLAQLFAGPLPEGKLGEKLAHHQQQARMSYALVRLRRDLQLGLDLKQFRRETP